VANFLRKAVRGHQPTSNDGLPEEIARSLDAAADDLRHDRTEDLREYVKRKQAELEAHIARESAKGF
jgi:hypothetical protein